jgi:hypothetical protein
MNESEMVASAELVIYADPDATMTEAGDGWFGRTLAVRAARLAVAAWARAVNGDDSALAALADDVPDRVGWLLQPESLNPWRPQWTVAPDPVVTELRIWSLSPTADPPELNAQWLFTGRRRWTDPEQEHSGGPDDELPFVGMATLKLTGSDPWPWQLALGSVQTLDAYLGYTYTVSTETAEEYKERTGADPGRPLAPTDTYLLVADFTEDDVKFGSKVAVEISSDSALTREEAARLVEPAMQADVVQWRGGEVGDWHPTLRALRVTRLLGPA